MNKTLAKKYLSNIKNYKKKYLTSEQLSKINGIYPEIISSELSYFEPMLAMDPSFNLKDLLPQIEEYIASIESNKEKVKYFEAKKESKKYSGVTDFVYKKMTVVGGLVDKSITLSDEDLKVLRKLVNEELLSRKKK